MKQSETFAMLIESVYDAAKPEGNVGNNRSPVYSYKVDVAGSSPASPIKVNPTSTSPVHELKGAGSFLTQARYLLPRAGVVL